MGKVRMADIAQRVGVSTVTVHNALLGQKGVSDEVRGRILQAAEEMGYRQRKTLALQEKKSGLKNIGVIISERYLAEYITFYWKMYQEMALIATEKNCAVMVEILKHYNEDHLVVPRIVQEGTVDGLIVLGELHREYIRYMKTQTNIPIVFLDFYDKELANDAVIADNFYGMYLMTEYLFEKGFRRMAYVGSIHSTSSIMDRYCGFYKALLEHGVDLKPEWLLEDRDELGEMHVTLPARLPEAFVCNCDLAAGMLIMQLEERGIRVPEDISVVGFDNYLYPGFPDKKITSYEVNTKAMVKVALEKVLKQMRSAGHGRGLDIVSGHIVEKQSVRR